MGWGGGTVESCKTFLRRKPVEAEKIVELNGLMFDGLTEDSLSSREVFGGGEEQERRKDFPGRENVRKMVKKIEEKEENIGKGEKEVTSKGGKRKEK